jgi:outer membrane lipoprotein-sorting protein
VNCATSFIAGMFLTGLTTVSLASTDSATWLKQYLEPLERGHQTAETKRGLEIYRTQYLTDKGWRSFEVTLDMRLIDGTGHESRRTVVQRKIEEDQQPNKTLGIFVEPADVRGTVMLTFEKSFGSDEQWLYLPAYKRTKKINAENKSGSFLGTEFSWEDISTSELTKFHYRYVRDEGKTWVVERTPVYKFSGYSREITWVDKSNHQTVKIEYYDRKSELLKTLVLTNWQKYLDRYWRPLRMEMTNHVNHRTTVIALSPYKMDAGLDKKMFSSLDLDEIPVPDAVMAVR